jgi:hypothetical protein
MTADERARITELGRQRGAELAHTVAGKTRTLRILIGPELDRIGRAKAS